MEPIKDILWFEINPTTGDTKREIRFEKHPEHLYLQFRGMHFNFLFSFVEVSSADPGLSGSLSILTPITDRILHRIPILDRILHRIPISDRIH